MGLVRSHFQRNNEPILMRPMKVVLMGYIMQNNFSRTKDNKKFLEIENMSIDHICENKFFICIEVSDKITKKSRYLDTNIYVKIQVYFEKVLIISKVAYCNISRSSQIM